MKISNSDEKFTPTVDWIADKYFELNYKIVYITNTLNSINNSIYKIINISMNLENQIDSTVSMTDC